MPESECSKGTDRQSIIDNAGWLTGREVRLITLSGLISGEASALYPQVCALVVPVHVNPYTSRSDFSDEVLFSAHYTDTRRDPSQRIGMKEQDMVDEVVKLLRRDIERQMGRVIQSDEHGFFHLDRQNLKPNWSKGQGTVTSRKHPKAKTISTEDRELSMIFDSSSEEDRIIRKNTNQESQFMELSDDYDDTDTNIIERASHAANQALHEDLKTAAHEVEREERQRAADLGRKLNRGSSRARTRRAIEPAQGDTIRRRKIRKT